MSDNSMQRPADQERRSRPDLRIIFEHIIERIAPFYRQSLVSGNTPMELWAKRTIREQHPELSDQDLQTLVSAANRYFKSNQAGTGA